MTLRVPSPPELRRRSRYLPVVGRSAAAHAARCNSDSLDIFSFGRLWLSCKGIQLPLHPSMPRYRDAHGMLLSFAFPIGWRHSDLALPQPSRSCPISAPAVTRPDYVQYPFHRYGDSGDYQRSFFLNSASAFEADPARHWLSAAIAGAGLHPHFQVDALATYPGAYLSRASQAIGASHGLAGRRHPVLDQPTGPVNLMAFSKSGGRWNLAHLWCLLIGHGGTDPPRAKCIASQVR